MISQTKFLLDSGGPLEFKEISELAKKHDSEVWGATTNPTLIAKKLAGKKVSQKEAFELQKEIVLQIIDIVPGAVSAEVYADEKTPASLMIEQGKEIATWHQRVVVKLPTTIEGFKARTELRKTQIPVNNTLVFSLPQIFAICLHEQIMQKNYGPFSNLWPPFISPFVGRLDDMEENGMDLVDHGMKIKKQFILTLPDTALPMWMLEASVRKLEHIKLGIDLQTELITAPAKVYREWFSLSKQQQEELTSGYTQVLKPINYWTPSLDVGAINTVEKFMAAIESGPLYIRHDLTDKGITKFADDWKAIIQ